MSIVQYYSYDRDSCGYCQTTRGYKRYGLWTYKLTVDDYQALIDRGWRRCGLFCYKPTLSDACCVMYTIRCDTRDFQLSRSQKRVLKRMSAYLLTGNKGRTKSVSNETGGLKDVDLGWKGAVPEVQLDTSKLLQQIKTEGETSTAQPKTVVASTDRQLEIDPNPTSSRTVKVLEKGSFKAKNLRIKRKLEKLQAQGFSEGEINKKMIEKKRYPVIKSVEDFVNSRGQQAGAHRLEVRLVRSSPRSAEFDETYEAGFLLFKKYQEVIHKDPPEKITRSSYDRFLVNSPLQEEQGLGSFHQQYWMDDVLIAVGVIDILPICVSSVYLFYDPDYAFLNLGTYAALREINLVRSITKNLPALAYYYMGFYIRTCPKMRYKGAFNPSSLLCPEVYTWHPIHTCLPKIDQQQYTRLNEDPDAQDLEGDPSVADNVKIVYKNKVTLLGNIPTLRSSYRELVQEYCSLVGGTCARRMLLHLS